MFAALKRDLRVGELSGTRAEPLEELTHLLALAPQGPPQAGALVGLGEPAGELPEDVPIEDVQRLLAPTVGVDHADDLRTDHDRRGGVGLRTQQRDELAVDARTDIRVEHDRRPSPAQQLGLDQRMLEPQGRGLELLDRGARRGGIAREMRILGDHPAAPHEADDRALESRARAQHRRRAAQHRAWRCHLPQFRDSGLDPRQRVEARLEPLAQPGQRRLVLLGESGCRVGRAVLQAPDQLRDQDPELLEIAMPSLGSAGRSISERACAVTRSSRRASSSSSGRAWSAPDVTGLPRRMSLGRPASGLSHRTTPDPVARTYRDTASARLVAPSLRRMFLTWYLTVPSRTTSALAIARFV